MSEERALNGLDTSNKIKSEESREQDVEDNHRSGQ